MLVEVTTPVSGVNNEFVLVFDALATPLCAEHPVSFLLEVGVCVVWAQRNNKTKRTSRCELNKRIQENPKDRLAMQVPAGPDAETVGVRHHGSERSGMRSTAGGERDSDG